MDEDRICAECGEPIGEDDEGYELEDGSEICSDCYSEYYGECIDCGEIVRLDESEPWGDDYRICQDCLEERCPEFDPEEQLRKTRPLLDVLTAHLLGRRVKEQWWSPNLDWDWNGADSVDYKISLTTDGDRRITGVGPLTGELVLADGLKSHVSRPYPVDKDSYIQAAYELVKLLEEE